MTKAKVENYTAAQVAQITADYAAGMDVKVIAEKVGKSFRSVVAKLSREKLYVKKAYVAKDGSKAETKAEMVNKIAVALNVAPEVVGSLESGTKQALKAVLAGLE